MGVALTVDLQQFADLIPKLVGASSKTLAEVVKQQTKLLVRGSGEGRDEGLVPYTPPPKGLEQGKAAVSRDINRVFVTATTARKLVKNSGQRGLSVAFNRAVAAGNTKRMLEILSNSTPQQFQVRGYTTSRKGKAVTVKPYTVTRPVSSLGNNALLGLRKVGQTPDRSTHKQRKGQTGKVRKERWSQLVLQSGSLAQYIKQIQKRVGIMKAGWRPAALALGVTLPKFVADAPRGSGSIQMNLDGENPSITVTNATPGIAKSLNSVLDRALRGRRMRMAKDIENKLAAQLAKQGGA